MGIKDVNHIKYFKIKMITRTIIKERLKDIFLERFFAESGGHWKSNPAHGSALANNFQAYKSFDYNDQQLVDDGNLASFSTLMLFDILTTSKYRKVNAAGQNEIILKIQETNKYFEMYSHQGTCSDELYEEYKSKFVSLIAQLDKSRKPIVKSSITSINAEIEKKYNEADGISATNKSNEKLANEIKDKANRQYSNKNYKEARSLYDSAMDLDGISDFTMSALHLNTTATFWEQYLSIVQDTTNQIPNNEDYIYLEQGKANAFHALCLRPAYTKAYLRLARIYSKFSSYQYAIELMNSALIIEPTCKEFISFRKELIIKHKERSELTKNDFSSMGMNGIDPSFLSKMLGGLSLSRNFEKEATDKLASIGLLGKFGGKLVTNEFVEQQLPNDEMLIQLKQLARENSLPEKLAVDYRLHLYTTSGINPSIIKECLSRLIESDTNYSSPYIAYTMFSKIGLCGKIDDELFLALLFKASLQPIKFNKTTAGVTATTTTTTIPNGDKMLRSLCENGFKIAAITELGDTFRHGKYGQDIDFERAKYYYEQAIKHIKDNNTSQDDVLKLCNVAFFNLGHMHLHGRIHNNILTGNYIPDRNKCKELWMEGASQVHNEPACYTYLKQEFGSSDPQLNKFLRECEKKQKVNEKENTRIDGCGYFDSEFNSLFSIDFPLVKDHVEKGSEWCKQIYSTHLKVLSFNKLYDAYNEKTEQERQSIPLQDKLEIIKPLANAYKDYESFIFVILSKRLDGTKELVNQLLKESPTNIDVRICWIGLYRFGNQGERLEFVNDSIKLLTTKLKNSTTTATQDNKDLIVLRYYHCVFQMYKGQFVDSLKSAAKYYGDKNNVQKDKDIFIYMMLSAIRFIDPTTLMETPGFENILRACIDGSMNTKLPKDDPLRAELCYNMSLLSSKIGVPKSQSMDFYKSGESIHKKIPQIIKVNYKLDKCQQAAKTKLF